MKTLRLALLLLLAAAVPAHAADDPSKPKKRGQRAAQKLHVFTIEEVLKAEDKDGDGRISKTEFLHEAYDRFMKSGGGKNNKKLDKDGDGTVSYDEWLAAPQSNAPKDRFRKFDKDSSGFLEKSELEALVGELNRDSRKRLAAFIERFDENGDGKVTREEFRGAEQIFNRLDRNGDGIITMEDEVPGAPASLAFPPAPDAPGSIQR